MNMTRKPVSRVHMRLSETRLWPAKSATSSSVGLPAVFAGTSAIPPVAVPAGSGLHRGGGAGAAAHAANPAGPPGLCRADNHTPAPRKAPTTGPGGLGPHLPL